MQKNNKIQNGFIKIAKPKIILVLGMHRSGTSLVAQLIAKWGAYMGEEIMEANEFNEDGYWEDMKLFRFHEKILKEQSNTWYAPPEILNTDKLIEEYGDEAKLLVEQMDRKNQVWCWKDPRLIVLFDFWKKILDGRDIVYILSNRDPKAIALSLKKRDKMSYSISLLVWEVTMIKILQSLKKTDKYLFIYYEKLLAQPQKECKKLFNYLCETISIKREGHILHDMTGVVKPSLNHFQTINKGIRLSPFQEKLYNEIIKEKFDYIGELFNNRTWFWKDYLDIYKKNTELVNIHTPVSIAQLYIDLGDGYSGTNLLNKEINSDETRIEYDLNDFIDIKGLRFDPLNDYCKIIIRNISLICGNNKHKKIKYKTNAWAENENEYDFDTNDPQIYLELDNISAIKKIIIELEYLSVGIDSVAQMLEKKNLEISIKNQELKAIDNALSHKNNELQQKNAKNIESEKLIFQQKIIIQQYEELQKQKYDVILRLESENIKKDKLIRHKEKTIQQHELSLKQKQNLIQQMDNKIQENETEIYSQKKQINSLEQEIQKLNSVIQEKANQIQSKEQLIYSLYNSYSWKITKPFRWLHPLLIVFFYFFYPSNYIKVKQKLFYRFGKFLNLTKGSDIMYVASNEAIILKTLTKEYRRKSIRYVSWCENKTIKDAPVKVLAFYLPQFHAIPENDAWWGEGFTEWANVKPAQPQFKGHYQPKIPGELGYYNLLDLKISQRQVEIAKNYGIGGFCFHFYWFSGKQLLEKPIENYLLNTRLDLPFCISWANENWTRRWDGRKNDILIKQQHSPEYNLAFIKHVSKYMQDKRYIRINNKPLLMVYRPGLMPSARETAEIWRNWCRVNGIGEIYLAYVQSFEKTHPDEYGFDAAVEFPPNLFYPSIISHLVKPLNKGFKCDVYDWKTMVMRSEHYTMPDYKLFRGVCPSWDNTPRRKNESTIFINNHPDDFRKWVYNASVDTCKRFENPYERLVFINAWNEWAEGAYLEPDERYGYAYLQSIYDALQKLAIKEKYFIKLKNHKYVESKPKILVISNNIPRPDRSSGELRFVSILEMLLEFWQVDICVAPSHVEWNTSDELVPYIKKLSEKGIHVLPLKKDAFKKAINEIQYVGGYFNLFWIAEEVMPLFKSTQPGAFTIVDSVDVHYAREETQAKLGEIELSHVLQTKKRELGVYRAADVTIAVSKDDYYLLSDIEGVRNVFLIPNIVSVYPRKPGKRDPKVVFIGSYTWYPNPGAVKWFSSEIWPIVIKAIPHAEFLIIGSDPTKEVLALADIPGIKVVGYVNETKPYLEMAAVSVAPMRVGSGMKGKVNEAMAHGIPVVATKIGAQGFEAVHGKQMMIADDADKFADCVIKLLQDDTLQHDMGKAGQDLNSAICSHDSVKVKIEELFGICNRLTPQKSHRSLRQWLIPNTFRFSVTVTDISNGFKYLKREGINKTLHRFFLYIKGEEPSEMIEQNKQKPSTVVEQKKDEPSFFELIKPNRLLEFPATPDAPLVSIIIPVYNQWEYTYACFDSILKNSGDIKYEIILADDNSTEDTSLVEKFIKNIRVIRNKKNLRFLFNCNNAAKFARGKYIVLLNNDTLVQSDWLKWFMKTMEEKPDIGMVGAKLVFSNGKLQEAGGIVFKDGSAMNYGREDNSDLPQYNYLKDVDYCSGACICIRKELWIKADGFDPIYAPGYYEDTDLAMQIRAMGYRTIYQPKSVIIHFEGISHGTDITKGIKKMQPQNQRVFFEKWKNELERNNYYRDENLFKARDKSKHKQTVLLIDYKVPNISNPDGKKKSEQMINHYIELGFNIKFLPDNFLRQEPDVSELEQNQIEVLYGEWYKENWQQWITENAGNINSLCFIDESLANKYAPILKNLLNKNFRYLIYGQTTVFQFEMNSFSHQLKAK